MDERIRPIDASHIASLIRIGEETGLSPWSAQNYLDELQNRNAIMFRLERRDGETIGFVVGRLVIASDADDAVDAEIFNIAVIEPEQTRGLGQVILDEFVTRCRAFHVRKIWLEVRTSNARARIFYEKNGFTTVARRAALYSNPPEAGLVMAREL